MVLSWTLIFIPFLSLVSLNTMIWVICVCMRWVNGYVWVLVCLYWHVMKQVEKSQTFHILLCKLGGEREIKRERLKKTEGRRNIFLHFCTFERTLIFRTILEQVARISDDSNLDIHQLIIIPFYFLL